MKKEQFDLSWGEPVCVREVLNSLYKNTISTVDIVNMSYPNYDGITELTDYLKHTLNAKYIIITNGATQAINISLRVLKKHENKNICVTNKYYFPYYPYIIEKNGYIHEKNLIDNVSDRTPRVMLIDMPSNPHGDIFPINNLANNVIWDSVYHNEVYINHNNIHNIITNIDYRINAGSFSKLFGLTGARVGWIAINSENDYRLLAEECKFENSGVSVVSQNLMLDILKTIDMDRFTRTARMRINMNREEISKLSGFFDNQQIPVNGMFYTAWVQDKGIKIIERAGVKFVELDSEKNNKLIRLNLAQNNGITKSAVKAIKTADRISNKRTKSC